MIAWLEESCLKITILIFFSPIVIFGISLTLLSCPALLLAWYIFFTLLLEMSTEEKAMTCVCSEKDNDDELFPVSPVSTLWQSCIHSLLLTICQGYAHRILDDDRRCTSLYGTGNKMENEMVLYERDSVYLVYSWKN